MFKNMQRNLCRQCSKTLVNLIEGMHHTQVYFERYSRSYPIGRVVGRQICHFVVTLIGEVKQRHLR